MKAKWPYLRSFFSENKFLTLATFLAGLLSNVFSVLIPISIGKYYNIVFYFDTLKSGILDVFPAHFWVSFSNFILFFTGIILLKMIAAFAEKYMTGILGERFVYKVRNDLFDHQLHMQMREYDERGISRYLLRYSGDLKSLYNYLTTGIISFSSDLVLILISVAILLLIDLWLFAILILFLLAILVVINLLNDRLYNISLLRRGAKSGLIAFVNNGLRSILTIKFFNKSASSVRKFIQKSERVYKIDVRFQFLNSIINSVIPSLLFMMLALILVYIYYQRMSGGTVIDGGTLLTAILILITILPVLRRTISVTSKWKLGNLSIEKLIVTFKKPVEKSSEYPDLVYKEGSIKFSNVSFRYREDRGIFENLNLEFAPGQISMLKGKTGDGKSTLLKLLSAIYLPDKGSITIDGQDLSGLNPASIRSHVAVVSPDLPFLGKTVLDAICRNKKPESEIEAREVLKMVQEHLSQRMHLKLDSSIGDLGSNLSIGQKQLLAFARAILTNKEILIADEPFHGLDIKSAEQIARLLRKLKTNKTIILLSAQDFQNFGDVWQILGIDKEVVLKPRSGKPIAPKKGTGEPEKEIVFENIFVTDRKGRPIFQGIDLRLPASKLSLIVVDNKREKRILRQLLAGELEAEKGDLSISGEKITVQPASLQKIVGVAGGKLDLKEKYVIDAIVTGSKEKIEKAERMLENLQRNMEENERVSPSDLVPKEAETWNRTQQMIVSYTRALISEKPIIVIDQAFKDLADRTIQEFARVLRKLKGQRTVVLINQGELEVTQDVLFILDIDKVIRLAPK